MLKKLFIAVIVLTCFASCKTKSAFNYNQDFVAKEQSLVPEITKTEGKVESFLAKEQFDSIGAAGEKMEKLVDAQLQKISEEKAPDVPGSDDFKKACVQYFSFIKSMYTGYKNFGYAKSADERTAEMSKVRDVINGKTEQIMAIKTAQTKFASANGFRIEEK
jgi:hypothetical protein